MVEGVAGEGAERCGSGGADSKVDCIEAVHQLYHYLDGELTEERRHEIAVHLDACSSCGSAAEFEAELRAVIANRCRDRVPESLMARIAGAIHEEAQHHEEPTGRGSAP